MPIVPDTYIGKITFYESHIDAWTGQPTSIGLTASDCTALAAKIGIARTAYNDQQTALNAAKAATNTMHNAVNEMAALGAIDLGKIKNFATATANPEVYSKAEIPPPATPSPVGPPGTPTDFSVSLNQTGAVTVKFKCANPANSSGTQYQIRRKIGSGAFAFLPNVGKKTFTDATIPAGSTGVMYEITATRSALKGEPALFTVNFGVGGDGMVFATVSEIESQPMKMAA